MYITLRGIPKTESAAATAEPGAGPGRSGRGRIGATVLGLGTVSLLTDISSESVAAVLPLYITLVVGLGPLAFGFIDGVYQGISAVVPKPEKRRQRRHGDPAGAGVQGAVRLVRPG